MDPAKVPYPTAFGVPVYYYWQFMEQNGFNTMIDAMLADTHFVNNASVRDARLAALRDSMMNAPIDPAFEVKLFEKLNTKFPPDINIRFRSSTNAEDLDGFTGAGLYISESGNPSKPKTVRNAIRLVWSSVWFFRAFEERSYRNIDHKSVGMALLVHQAFPTEEATGVAITTNIFDNAGIPGFYVNVQVNGSSVVLPDSNVTTDQFIYYYDMAGQPIAYFGRSNLLPAGQATVLTPAQVRTLGTALLAIHDFFKPLYGKDSSKKYGMDTEFKFDQPLDDPNGEPGLSMKQCRPYYSQGQQ